MINNSSLKLCSISLALLFVAILPGSVTAHEGEYNNFPTGEHEGGGVRGRGIGCVAIDAQNPQALISSTKEIQTVSSNPELLFYVPDSIQASTLEIRLTNQNNQIVSQQEFLTEDQYEIVSVKLLDNTNNNTLKLNSSYSWSLIQECAGTPTPKIVASGSIRRIELSSDLGQQLTIASPIEQIKLYQSANLWHEAIAHLVQLECFNFIQPTEEQATVNLENLTDAENLLTLSVDNYCPHNPESTSIVMN